jgi:cell wall-associated NlpC family hydrolase
MYNKSLFKSVFSIFAQMKFKKTYFVACILLFFALSSCVKRSYISEDVIYSVDDSETVIDASDNDRPNRNALFTDEQKLLDSIINFSKKYIGTPYKYGGTTPNGFDCSGFVQFLFNNFGIKIPRMPADMAELSDKVDYRDIRPGDLVYFKGSNINSMEIGHVALVVERNGDNFKFIHATSKGVIINDIELYDYWKTRYLFATRFKKETLGLK